MDSQGPSRLPLAVRALTDLQTATRVFKYAIGLPTPLATADRVLLEQIVLPYYVARPDVGRVLFVGVAWYTAHYPKAHLNSVDLWTADAEPAARKYGAHRHVTAPLEELDKHFAPNAFDLIVCNGVYGHGLNDKDQCERGFAVCHTLLRPGGHLLLGWNDSPDYPAAPLASIESLALFLHFEMPVLRTWRYRTDTPYAHTYDFYQRGLSG